MAVYAFILDDVIPALDSLAVSQNDIRKMAVENPRAILVGS
jgi:predicted metal-dependent phosphotriesterase family hydrolase